MKTKSLEICNSEPEDIRSYQVPPFEVFANGVESYSGAPFSRHVGYFQSVEEAVKYCEGSDCKFKNLAK